ncbi:hypothetical protein [Bordetella genomosp. 4]|uniref:Uncharacterized protein n=1 Tax=Bordetella genomosp. 4 TaxID=463044 RepID=A0A261UB50_9BORD|nr:hypothetical protein [Bordetella genomosp. 4]OZI52680.1 hypothetical protein CAL21_03380 [Bordetella genomosp. 4]OZI59134.1 hypothetical protein CAL20_05755 [Bordetella genomosp. 4]
MALYRLATVFGYVLLIGAVAFFIGYFALMVLVTGFFGNESVLKWAMGAFFLGILLFQARALVVDFLAERVVKHGVRTTGRVVAVEHSGKQEVGDRVWADWYQVIVQMAPLPGLTGERQAHIEQLFMKGATAWLKQGATVPIKYAPDLRLAIIDHEQAYPRLHAGSQFAWRRLR